MVSATFFTLLALRSGDALGLLGALLFLVACFAFLVRYFADERSDGYGWTSAGTFREIEPWPHARSRRCPR